MSEIKMHLITWLLICIGWVATNAISYQFGVKKHETERAENVLEEVSTMIESGYRISQSLVNSFCGDEKPVKREDKWRQYEELQDRFYGNRSRYQYLLNKYFGYKIATHVDFIMQSQIPEVTRSSCEADKSFPECIWGYYETWTSGGSQDPLGEADGYKWKMMKKCGMDVGPYIKELQKIQSSYKVESIKIP